MKKKLFLRKIVFVIIGGVSCILFWFVIKTVFFPVQIPQESFFVEFHGKRLLLERAVTEEARALGLGKRDSLCSSCALQFIFETPGRYLFWMKDMRFPIDIVWLRGEEVVFIVHNAQPEFLGVFDPGVFADTVFECNAGEAKNLREGDRVRFLH
ncbi:MAG: DUF192 domain-containing protein [Candidatus Moranbacteria bacterium]|nr:DUF192 domain-containing protein [Candidatus Moranbacteria bacterium]